MTEETRTDMEAMAEGTSVGYRAPHISMRGIVKRFGNLVANDHIDFDVRPAEVHALVGQNGAGKTTLMRILFGLVRPDAGEIFINGSAVDLRSPSDALRHGIGMVHQHFLLVSSLTVAENVVLGSRPVWPPHLSQSAIVAEVRELAQQVGFAIDPREVVANLPVDVQQRVEILKLLYRGANILILDEPTASLGPNEAREAFKSLLDLRGTGRSIVIITHKLAEVVKLADRVTVLRQGRLVAVAQRGHFDEHSLAVAMLGSDLPAVSSRAAAPPVEGALRLRVLDMVVLGDRGERAVNGVDLAAKAGEIVGIAGVEGNGQRELAQALSGLRTPHSGNIEIEGVRLRHWDPHALRRAGVSVCTEDRQGWDLFMDLDLADNLLAIDVALGSFQRRGVLNRPAIFKRAESLLRDYQVEPSDPKLSAAALSGGNQQKLILARELARRPRILIAAQPTRGLDVGSSLFVHEQLIRLRSEGCAIVLVSHDLDELIELTDRIIVLYKGRVSYAEKTEQVTIERLADAMAGLRGE